MHQNFYEGLNLALQASQMKHLLQLRISKPELFQVCGRAAITLPDKAKPRDSIACELPGEKRTALAYPFCAVLRPPASTHRHAEQRRPATQSFKGLSSLTKTFPLRC